MTVHPIAALFPMISDDELQTLADDIKTNGLLHPIIIDANNQLIDGRNRLAACTLAGVTPTFAQLGNRDPVALILSANVHRRQLSKGQQAMAVAKAYPDAPQHGGARVKGQKQEQEELSSTCPTLSDKLLQKARFVLKHATDLVDQVMAGGSLNEAYDAATDRKLQRELLEQQIKDRKLTLEQIGAAPVPIVVKADLSPIDLTNTEHGFPRLPTKDAIEEQQVLLRALLAISQRLEGLATAATLPPLSDHAMYVSAIRSSARLIIAHANTIADNYNKTLVQPSLKRVK